MALFKKEKKQKEERTDDSASAKQAVQSQAQSTPATAGNEKSRDVTYVLRKPRITEKATFATENSVYVFEVASWANKKQIAEAVRYTYKVEPVKVNVVKIQPKQLRSSFRRHGGVKQGGKKAYVYLKEGERIEFV